MRAENVKCYYCGAAPGRECAFGNGARLVEGIHTARLELAEDLTRAALADASAKKAEP